VSEKLKLNFTPVPNIIFDEIMRTFTPAAGCLVFAICRYTYGWGKPQGDEISLKELQEMTGLTRWGIVRARKQLDRLVTITPGAAGRASRYRLNVEIPDVDLDTLSDQSQKVTSHRGSHLKSPIQRKSKERNTPAGSRKKNPPPDDSEFERAWSLYPKRAGGNPKEKARSAWRARLREGVKPEELRAGVERYANYVCAVGSEGTQYVKQAATFFGPDKHWRDDWVLPRNLCERSGEGFVV
jgi:hypothetical protein